MCQVDVGSLTLSGRPTSLRWWILLDDHAPRRVRPMPIVQVEMEMELVCSILLFVFFELWKIDGFDVFNHESALLMKRFSEVGRSYFKTLLAGLAVHSSDCLRWLCLCAQMLPVEQARQACTVPFRQLCGGPPRAQAGFSGFSSAKCSTNRSSGVSAAIEFSAASGVLT